ncbi:hypothetical protein KY327_00570 [Candidatus Woesearchaeota archaeon]|nr:hypothetical protein [Candidatus Woesearchaeota archaeon]
MAGGFQGAIGFLEQLGVYDVVLPFLLVFTLVYAFLEKTRIFGTETYYFFDDKKYDKGYQGSRKNLNAMASFVISFFVVASSQLVAVINQALAHTVLLLILIFAFLLVAGSFHQQTDEGFFLQKPWKNIFMIVTAVGIAFIFLNALGWLDVFWNWITSAGSSNAVASVVLIGFIAGFIALITKEPKKGSEKSED